MNSFPFLLAAQAVERMQFSKTLIRYQDGHSPIAVEIRDRGKIAIAPQSAEIFFPNHALRSGRGDVHRPQSAGQWRASRCGLPLTARRIRGDTRTVPSTTSVGVTGSNVGNDFHA